MQVTTVACPNCPKQQQDKMVIQNFGSVFKQERSKFRLLKLSYRRLLIKLVIQILKFEKNTKLPCQSLGKPFCFLPFDSSSFHTSLPFQIFPLFQYKFDSWPQNAANDRRWRAMCLHTRTPHIRFRKKGRRGETGKSDYHSMGHFLRKTCLSDCGLSNCRKKFKKLRNF